LRIRPSFGSAPYGTYALATRVTLSEKLHEADEVRMPEQTSEPDSLDEMISRHIRRVLSRTKGKVHGPGGAADLLGINPSTLRNRMNKLGIVYGRKA
ncbi:MAG: hypothetical protein KAQ78_01575, partial [Candidatus Latescibacteria bacterium]|nr:hypothetical protein [Candidatus Latescibacterota bacterium]